MAEPLGAAELQGLPDRGEPEGLAGVDREMEVLPANVIERVEVAGGWVAGFRAGDVESHDPLIPPTDGQFGDLERASRRPHRRQQRADADPGALGTFAEPFLHGLDHLVESEPALEVLLGRETDLGVDDAVGGEVLGTFARHARERVLRLHHADGVRERLEVQQEVLAVGALGHPVAELPRVGGRQVPVAGLLGELHDRAGTEPAVEVVVEEDLRDFSDLFERRSHDRMIGVVPSPQGDVIRTARGSCT